MTSISIISRFGSSCTLRSPSAPTRTPIVTLAQKALPPHLIITSNNHNIHNHNIHNEPRTASMKMMIAIPTTPLSARGGHSAVTPPAPAPITRGLWSEQEHEQFLHAMKMFPTGPWRSIAAFIGTRSIKQVQTHAQKYQQKINRRRRGLRKQKKKFVRPEHRVDAHATGCIQRVKNFAMQGSPRSPSSFPMGAMSPLSGSFGQLLTGACSPVASEAGSCASSSSTSLDVDFELMDMDALMGDMDPLPFTSGVAYEDVLADEAYRQDVQESIDLLLA